MSLETPEKIRTFQRKLFVEHVETESRLRLRLTIKLCREDILHHAFTLAQCDLQMPIADSASTTAHQ
jgi:RNA-directed DNA polymerase